MRVRLARFLRDAADRISPETGPRGFPAHFTIEEGVGIVIHQTDGVRVYPPVDGCRLWYMAEDYDRAWRSK